MSRGLCLCRMASWICVAVDSTPNVFGGTKSCARDVQWGGLCRNQVKHSGWRKERTLPDEGSDHLDIPDKNARHNSFFGAVYTIWRTRTRPWPCCCLMKTQLLQERNCAFLACYCSQVLWVLKSTQYAWGHKWLGLRVWDCLVPKIVGFQCVCCL